LASALLHKTEHCETMADENQNRRVLEPKSKVELLRCALKANIDHLETALTQENEKLKQLMQENEKLKQENENLKQENENLKRALAQKRVQERLESKASDESKPAAISAATTLGVQQLEGVDTENTVKSYLTTGKACGERGDYAAAIENYKKALAIQEHDGSNARSLAATNFSIYNMFQKQGDDSAAYEYYMKGTSLFVEHCGMN
jgi:tetratricopeptide (TPR) repeat protein